mmetsp:Transcript_116743/g.330258  ORF Transcript_116743/g.330258 Transcript_116743/m.330258 type:complete len:85 (-) Transcript_116743:17-271(-)
MLHLSLLEPLALSAAAVIDGSPTRESVMSVNPRAEVALLPHGGLNVGTTAVGLSSDGLPKLFVVQQPMGPSRLPAARAGSERAV